MTNEATDNVTEDVQTPEGPLSPAETHRQWKLNASAVLHDLADSKSLCSVFDSVMADVGLPARERILNDVYARPSGAVTPDDVTGEDTPEAFEQWKRDTTRELSERGREHGISGVDDALARAGFPARVSREVVVSGEFKITLPNVRFYEDEESDLIDSLNTYDIAEAVYQAINGNGGTNNNNVTWKATLAPKEENESE